MSKLKKSVSTKREFGYNKGTCGLNFTLNIDTKSEVEDFKECLIAALSDIEDVLLTIK